MRRKGICWLLAAALCGCATPPPPVEVPATKPAVVVPEPPLDEIRTRPLARTPFPVRLPRIAIVVTGTQPAYADVATELAGHLRRFDLYDLSDESLPPVSVLRAINDTDTGAIIAVGLRAALSAVAMSDKPVVFSQVFNYQDYDLLTDSSRGVAALAPPAAQLKAWKSVDPDIKRIGTIVGEGHRDLVAEAELAAELLGVELRIQVTHSDQETLYFFRRMIRDIDGFWLIPDNRVLSGRALRQMLAEARRLDIPVAVPNESLLEFGATISISTVASDIAETIVEVVRRIQNDGIESVPPLSPLTEVRVATRQRSLVVRQ